MPLTAKGEEIKENMVKEHGEKAGTSEFYASKNAGTISGVDDDGPPTPPSGPTEEPAVMPPQNISPFGASSGPQDCTEGDPFTKQHDFQADGNSPMGRLPQQMSFASMKSWKAF